MKIIVTVSKTIQERQYEPTSVSVSWEMDSDMTIAKDGTKYTYGILSELVDQLLESRTGRKVRRS